MHITLIPSDSPLAANVHAAPAEPSASLSDSIALAEKTHANLQDLVKVADAKATSFVALQAIVLAILGSNLWQEVTKAIRNSDPDSVTFLIFGGLMLLSTGISIGLCLRVMLPRSAAHIQSPSGARGLLWIEGINKHLSAPDGYLSALRGTTPEDRLADLAFENLKVAWILGEKFRCLKQAAPVIAWSFISWALLIVASIVAAPGSVVAP